jgi:hypothetical protein
LGGQLIAGPDSWRPARVAGYATLVGLALLVAVGCGGTAQTAGVAQVASTSSKSASPRPSVPTAADKLAFSRCMRSHGVPEWPDPINGRVGFSVHSPVAAIFDTPKVQAAYNLCGNRFLGFATRSTPAQRAEWNAQALKYSQCMRAHGASDFPDPEKGSGLIDLKSATYFDTPLVQRADQACKSLRKSGVAIASPIK